MIDRVFQPLTSQNSQLGFRERRERIATAVLATLARDGETFVGAAQDAVKFADALIAELDKQP